MAVFPDYNKSIVSISNSLLKFFGAPVHHPSLPELDNILAKQRKSNIVFMILDCLGSEVLAKHLPQDSFFRRHVVCDVSSVFPPTTTAATTSLHSGLYPIEHGWVGWAPYFKEHDRVIEIFLNRDFYTLEMLSTPPVREALEAKTIYSQITEANPDVEYYRVFPPFDPQGVKSFEEMCEKIPDIIKSNTNRKIISAYWPYPDHDLHRNGTDSEVVRQCLYQMNQNLQMMAEKLSDTQLIITADHGIVDVEEVLLNDHPDLVACLALPPSLEARFISFFIKDEQKDFFAREFSKRFGADYLLLSKDDFIAGGFLGKGNMHKRITDFIGDFVAIGISNKSIRYKTEDGTGFKSFAADHAGLTPTELTVPLIVFNAD